MALEIAQVMEIRLYLEFKKTHTTWNGDCPVKLNGQIYADSEQILLKKAFEVETFCTLFVQTLPLDIHVSHD